MRKGNAAVCERDQVSCKGVFHPNMGSIQAPSTVQLTPTTLRFYSSDLLSQPAPCDASRLGIELFNPKDPRNVDRALAHP